MSEEMLARHCSPTLAGLKTGNMFTCFFANTAEMRESIRAWNRLLRKKGLRVIPLRYKNSRALIYVYRPAYLSRDLGRAEAGKILNELGYESEAPARCVVRLIEKLEENKEFPHEIGLFLGYPPEDVSGFIENRCKCKLVGFWKVYGDVAAAQKLFEKYKRCTEIYCAQVAQGWSVERLTVAG